MTRDERGFSLVEVLVTVTLVGLLMSGISAAYFGGWRTLDASRVDTQGSVDVAMLAYRLPRDVASATDAIASSTGAGITCTGASNPRLQLSDGSTFKVVYGITTSSNGTALVRHDCSTGTAANSTVVARGLADTSSVVAARNPTSGTFVSASIQITEQRGPGDTTAGDVFAVTGRRRTT